MTDLSQPTASTSTADTAARSWASVTRELEAVSLIDFVGACRSRSRVYLEHSELPTAYAGCGVAAEVSAHGPDRFRMIQRDLLTLSQQIIVQQDKAPEAAHPRWFGGFSFRSGHQPKGVWSAFPAAHFFLPRYQVAETEGAVWLTVTDALNPDETPTQALRRLEAEAQAFNPDRFDTQATPSSKSRPLRPGEPHRSGHGPIDDLMDELTWHDLIRDTTGRIHRGELEKVVLAQACSTPSRGVTPAGVLRHLKNRYPNCYRFLIEPAPGQAFLGATPELLARVQGREVETVAMASTVRRGTTPEEDRVLAQRLMDSQKERHEHEVVVRSIERHLSPLTDSLEIPPQPAVVRFSAIQHLQTPICGELTEACGILPVVQALHPTPAMGGVPRDVALQWIEEVEPFQRGWYASPVGWVDLAGNGLFAVAIRSALHAGDVVHLFAGAGIVADSDPEREWAEVQLKFRPILDALNDSWA